MRRRTTAAASTDKDKDDALEGGHAEEPPAPPARPPRDHRTSTARAEDPDDPVLHVSLVGLGVTLACALALEYNLWHWEGNGFYGLLLAGSGVLVVEWLA